MKHGDIYVAPLSGKVDLDARNLFFSSSGDITIDHARTCGDTCGFVINPTNKKITTNANVVHSTSVDGMQIKNVGGDIVLLPASGVVRIAGSLEVSDGTVTAVPDESSMTSVGSLISSTVSGDLTVQNPVGGSGGDIVMKPSSNILKIDGTEIYASPTQCNSAV